MTTSADIDSDSECADDSDSECADDSDSDGADAAALADSASHELSDGDAAACSAVYGSAVLRHCQRALQLLHDGGVRSSTAAAASRPQPHLMQLLAKLPPTRPHSSTDVTRNWSW
jgi:hypothetical protein